MDGNILNNDTDLVISPVNYNECASNNILQNGPKVQLGKKVTSKNVKTDTKLVCKKY